MTENGVIEEIERQLDIGMSASLFPGAQVTISCIANEDSYSNTVVRGGISYGKSSPLVTRETIYDVASLTKIIVTLPCILLLCDRKLISLSEPVSRYVPLPNNKSEILLSHALTHTSGIDFPSGFCAVERQSDELISAILNALTCLP